MGRVRILGLLGIALLMVALAGSVAHGSRSVRQVALAEFAHFEAQGIAVPTHTLVTLNPFEVMGYTVITPAPVQYLVILRNWYWREDQAAFVAAHELGHILLAEAGLPQEEELADRIAACFGSASARRWAAEVHRVKMGDCIALRTLVTGAETAPS